MWSVVKIAFEAIYGKDFYFPEANFIFQDKASKFLTAISAHKKRW
jgi:hypothetical protein